jgi:uncharacterized protein (TIGR02453 family)
MNVVKKTYFGPELFRFLRRLKRNNSREWFLANKATYERDVRDPLLRFIEDFAPRLNRLSSHFVADPRPVGGSLFRIHRDVRFSKDKSPYKTAAAAQFRHEAAKDVHAPGFYLHLEPSNVFFGAGLWRPDGKTLATIRDAIVENPSQWKRILSSRIFRANFTLSGDSLKKPPRGYDPEHPFIDDLKRKDYVITTWFSEEEACAADFLERFTLACRRAGSFVRFLTRGAGLTF